MATGKVIGNGILSLNRSVQTPFESLDPVRPNPKYSEHVDWVVDRAAHYGLRIALLPVWAPTYIASLRRGRILFLIDAYRRIVPK